MRLTIVSLISYRVFTLFREEQTLPAMRVCDKGYTKNVTFPYNRGVQALLEERKGDIHIIWQNSTTL